MAYKVRVRDMRYDGKVYRLGDPIAPKSERDARLLKAARKIEDAPDRPVRKAATPRPPRAPTPSESSRASAPAAAAKRPLVRPGRYLNRRMKADD